MIAALLILLPVVGVAVWAFFRFAPIHAERQAVTRVHVWSLAVVVSLATAWSVRTYLVMSPTVDAAWWPVISALGALIIVPLGLAVAAILRHFALFRRRNEVQRQ